VPSRARSLFKPDDKEETTMTPQELTAKEKQELAAGQEKTRPGRYFMPDVDIREFPDHLELWADMPGVSDKNLHVTLENGVLTLEGTVEVGLYDGLSPLYTEYNVGNYFRQFSLHESIDSAGIKASLRNGELQLTLPKIEAAKPRKIEVQVS
jgi:HSP20 family molecular chaperone IbpA